MGHLFEEDRGKKIATVLAVLFILALLLGGAISSYSGTAHPGSDQGEGLDGSAPGGEAGVSSQDNYLNLQQTPDSCFLYDVALADLCAADPSYQKKVVQVRGEVVGRSIKSEQNPGMYWITLHSEPGEKEGSLSVLVDEKHLGAIDSYGGYNTRGTILNVKGTFHVACTSHEGIMDIHADSASAIEPGSPMPDEFDFAAFMPGLFLCGVALLLHLVYRSFAEGER